ncbi:MAG: hypothetical protein MJZ81_04295 [Bacteroidales bacterium]|nr:hypothetical protein [Bacteroidales bacterium]
MGKTSSTWGPLHGKTRNVVFRMQRGHNVFYQIDTEAAPKAPSNKQLLQRSVFGLCIKYTSMYHAILNNSFANSSSRQGRDIFLKENSKALKAALLPLAQRQVNGEVISEAELDAAVSTYATANPRSIKISGLPGCSENFLTGPWPPTVEIKAFSEKEITVRLVNADGTYEDLYDYRLLGTSPAAGDIAITAMASPSNGGTVTGGGSYASGSSVTLRAEAANGFIFTGWSDGITTSSRSITVSGAATYTALFAAASNDDAIGE